MVLETTQTAENSPSQNSRDLYEIGHLGVGKPAPEITGTDAEGSGFALSDYRGNVLALVFSGEWCAPCRAQQPKLRALQAKYRDKAVRILGVWSDPPSRVREAALRGDITWRCWCDGNPSGAITTQWNICSWPAIYVLDRQGVIRSRNVAAGQLEGVVEGLLRE